MKVTLFDLDHTLLPIDSDHSWGVFTTAIGWTDPVEFARRNDAFYAQYKAGTLDIHDYVRFATEAIRGRGREAALAARARFMDEVIGPALLPQARSLVRQHQDAGDRVAIITATNAFVTRPIADALGVAELIALELECGPAADGQPWITGEIRGVPSVREGKVRRFTDWLGAQGLQRTQVRVRFYSDSTNDLPLLEACDEPVATNPEPRLRAIAAERGWPVLDLFPQDTP
jgi:HAD superfamily hydrolase (TIGR01490 family)